MLKIKDNVNLPKKVKEAFICIDYELSVCSCELPTILDYITNLQEENEKLKSYIKLTDEEAKEYMYDVNKEIDDYKSRIDEAKEILLCYGETFDSKVHQEMQKKLLDKLELKEGKQ